MAVMTLLPLGTMQLLVAIDNGYWYARSEQFMQQPFVDLLIWMRVPGDTILAIGALALALFVAMLWINPKRETDAVPVPKGEQTPGIVPDLDRTGTASGVND